MVVEEGLNRNFGDRPANVCKKLTVTVSKAWIEDIELLMFGEEQTKIRNKLGLAISYRPPDKNKPVALDNLLKEQRSQKLYLEHVGCSSPRKRDLMMPLEKGVKNLVLLRQLK